jgi:hypothetical protein
MSKAEIVPTTPDAALLPLDSPSDVMSIMRLVIERGGSVEALEKLVALKERVDDRAAAMEFNAALAAFQAECPPIAKKSIAKIATKAGGEYAYRYAELDQIKRITQPILSKNGLSTTWDSEEAGGKITCTCTLRHVGGHAQTAKFVCPTDTTSAMSSQQKNAAALTYARRQSLIQVLGLTTCDPDTDGKALESISFPDAEQIEAAIVSTKSDRAKFLAYMRVKDVSEILAGDLEKAHNALKAKGWVKP